jgi:hypothetical protein
MEMPQLFFLDPSDPTKKVLSNNRLWIPTSVISKVLSHLAIISFFISSFGQKWQYQDFEKFFKRIHSDGELKPSSKNHFDIAMNYEVEDVEITSIPLFNFLPEDPNKTCLSSVWPCLGQLGSGDGFVQHHGLCWDLQQIGINDITIYPLLKHAIIATATYELEAIPQSVANVLKRQKLWKEQLNSLMLNPGRFDFFLFFFYF